MNAKNKVSSLRSIERAAESGSEREFLVALRDHLTRALYDERTQPRDLSPLTLRLKELQAEIAALDAREEAEPDEVVDGTFDPESV